MNDIILFSDAVILQFSSLLFLVLGVLASIRMLNFPDLTVDGSFTIGACVFAVTTQANINPWLCVFSAVVAGGIAGAFTILLNEIFKIGQILSSVLVMLALVAMTPYILSSATIALLGKKTIFILLEYLDVKISKLLFPNEPFAIHFVFSFSLILFAFLVAFFLVRFFNSPLGVLVRYHGSAESPREFLGKRIFYVKLSALIIGNGLIALGGGIEAFKRGATDQNIGIGVILAALATLILGETVIRLLTKKTILSVKQEICAVVVGSLLYSILLQAIVQVGQGWVDIRLISTVFLALILAISSKKFPRNLEMF